MNETQKMKRSFRDTSEWKAFRKKKRAESGSLDEITLKNLRKGWELHHEDLDESHYKILNDNFVCLNKLTHKFIHWLYMYYQNDEEILNRIRIVMERMKEINKGVTNENC